MVYKTLSVIEKERAEAEKEYQKNSAESKSVLNDLKNADIFDADFSKKLNALSKADAAEEEAFDKLINTQRS